MIRKMTLGFVIFLVICAALYLRFHHARPLLGMAYSGSRGLTLYDSSAQVRSPIGTVDYGEPLQMLERFGDQIEVRTSKGLVGWTTYEDLISPELWQQEKDLDAKTGHTAPEARGHTRVISNLHLVPGRDTPRVRQLKKDVSVELFERQAIAVPEPTSALVAAPAPDAADDPSANNAAPSGPKKEDWWLVRATLDDKSSVSGWLLSRFVDLDVPAPLPDYASSAGMHIVAWFELNRVADANGNAVPQYLLVGVNGPEGQACDFTLMRVYTWAKNKGQYETAFVQSDVCGRLPLKIDHPAGTGDTTFAFTDPGDGTPQVYRMRQTIVRRVSDRDSANKRKP
ncbi:MAG TPA: SH3 domain-containing protein [Candidatus Acidoferrum sp.]|nr:SH3 domain-containing protein [Candidatus Acidoferrum sp.]